MLSISSEIIKRINAHGANAYPNEGCGLLLGIFRDGQNVVYDIFPTPNRWPVPEEKPIRFQISARDMLQAEMAAAEKEMDVVGIFHSHPDSEPVASPRDLAWAAWPGYSYLITAVRHGRPEESRSWQLQPDRSGFIEEPVQTTDQTSLEELNAEN